jgi:hypothetical protein
MTDQQAPLSTTARQDTTPRTRTVHVFVRMWAVAHVVHLCAANDGRLDSPWNVTVVAAALALMLRPASGRWLAVLAVAQLADLVAEMPVSPDHWMLLGFVNLVILSTLAARRSWDTAVIAGGFPAMRAVVLVTYGAAALAKYNTGFLDPVTSCATAIAGTASFGLAEGLGVPAFFVVAVLVAETSIPILLAIPRTRRHGVRLALAFHFTLSMSPAFAVVDYSAALFALFVLFLSDEDLAAIPDRINRVARHSAVVRDARRLPWLTAVLAFVAFGLLGYLSLRASAGVLFVASQIYLLGILLAALLTWRTARPARRFGRVLWLHLPILLLVLAWVMTPYLGLRTTGVFTMFSGIRTEGEAPNHVFLPTARLVDWQDDFVVIESTNDPALETAEGGHLGVPLLELRRMATDNPGLVVEGRLHGRDVTFGPEPDQRALEPLTGWQAVYLHFRPVAVSDRPFCSVS